MISTSQSELDWDFYFYVAMTLLKWDVTFFWQATPNHLMKQYIMHIRANNPDAIQEDVDAPKQSVFLDQTPYM